MKCETSFKCFSGVNVTFDFEGQGHKLFSMTDIVGAPVNINSIRQTICNLQ